MNELELPPRVLVATFCEVCECHVPQLPVWIGSSGLLTPLQPALPVIIVGAVVIRLECDTVAIGSRGAYALVRRGGEGKVAPLVGRGGKGTVAGARAAVSGALDTRGCA